MYVIADKDQDWIYIESGDVRGFVSREYLNMADTVKTEVEQKGEETYTTAESQIEQDENQARYYTLTSIKSGIPGEKCETPSWNLLLSLSEILMYGAVPV